MAVLMLLQARLHGWEPFRPFPFSATRQNWSAVMRGKLIGDEDKLRHLVFASCDVRVEFAVEASRVGARVLTHFGEKQSVESGPLGAVRTAPRFEQQSFVLFREWNRFEPEIDVLLNPHLQAGYRNKTALVVVHAVVAVEAMRERLLLRVGRELGNELRVFDADLLGQKSIGGWLDEVEQFQAPRNERGGFASLGGDFFSGVLRTFSVEQSAKTLRL